MTGLRYLRSRSLERSDLEPHHQRYAALRDEFVIGFRYQTARAYAADLDHLFGWALTSGLDVMGLTVNDIEQYVAELKVEKFSPNTMIRKRTALRGFYSLAAATEARTHSPMTGWPWRRRSETLGCQPS